MNHVEIYSKKLCIYCLRAKFLFKRMGVAYQVIDVTHDSEKLSEMHSRSKRSTVPQIFINGRHIGGSDDLAKAKRSGELNSYLKI